MLKINCKTDERSTHLNRLDDAQYYHVHHEHKKTPSNKV